MVGSESTGSRIHPGSPIPVFEDELEFKKGDFFLLLTEEKDGWCQGRSIEI